MQLRTVLPLVLVAACSGSKAPGVPADAARPPVAAARPDAAVTTPAPPPAAPAAEVFDGPAAFYRTPGGTATLRLPPLDASWTVFAPRAAGTGRVLTLVRREKQRARGVVQVFFHDTATAGVTAAAVARYQAVVLQKLAPDLTIAGEEPSGELYLVKLVGKKEAAAVLAVASGGVAVGIVVRSALADFEPLAPVARSLLDGLRLGERVARLPPHDPGTRLGGVFSGPTLVDTARKLMVHKWYTFDPRGYVIAAPPDGELRLDPEALFQADPHALGLGRYTVVGANLTIAWLDGAPATTLALEAVDARTLRLDQAVYRRVDGPTAAPADFRLDAAYELKDNRLLVTEGELQTSHTFFVDNGLVYVDGALWKP